MSLQSLKQAMLNCDQAACPVSHHFSDGLYARELFIPKGVSLVGAKHLTNHLFVMLYGHCQISVDGEEAIEVQGHYIGETQAGTQKAFYALEDSLFLSFHVTEETDLYKLGDEILEKEQGCLPQWKRQLLEVVQ